MAQEKKRKSKQKRDRITWLFLLGVGCCCICCYVVGLHGFFYGRDELAHGFYSLLCDHDRKALAVALAVALSHAMPRASNALGVVLALDVRKVGHVL